MLTPRVCNWSRHNTPLITIFNIRLVHIYILHLTSLTIWLQMLLETLCYFRLTILLTQSMTVSAIMIEKIIIVCGFLSVMSQPPITNRMTEEIMFRYQMDWRMLNIVTSIMVVQLIIIEKRRQSCRILWVYVVTMAYLRDFLEGWCQGGILFLASPIKWLTWLHIKTPIWVNIHAIRLVKTLFRGLAELDTDIGTNLWNFLNVWSEFLSDSTYISPKIMVKYVWEGVCLHYSHYP